ncbi:MAG: DegT/DnrJ/EryC1/StrS family aminotransferase, partial [Phycisphaerae bacterium]|nr:DegT/DnrJ/EryC1/StrS family aminotransferase [Phycisphaerae bacterium]
GGWLAHERLGYNFRLSDINCAMGIVQLERAEDILASRLRVAKMYLERLAGDPRLIRQKVLDGVRMSWFVFVVRLADDYTRQDRDRILVQLREKGIGCSNYFAPIHLQPFYVERFGFAPGDFPVCEALSDRTIALPFHAHLAEREIDYVCTMLKSLL